MFPPAVPCLIYIQGHTAKQGNQLKINKRFSSQVWQDEKISSAEHNIHMHTHAHVHIHTCAYKLTLKHNDTHTHMHISRKKTKYINVKHILWSDGNVYPQWDYLSILTTFPACSSDNRTRQSSTNRAWRVQETSSPLFAGSKRSTLAERGLNNCVWHRHLQLHGDQRLLW